MKSKLDKNDKMIVPKPQILHLIRSQNFTARIVISFYEFVVFCDIYAETRYSPPDFIVFIFLILSNDGRKMYKYYVFNHLGYSSQKMGSVVTFQLYSAD